jgi:hypothetical protein
VEQRLGPLLCEKWLISLREPFTTVQQVGYAFMQTSDPDIYAVVVMTEPDCFLSPTPSILPEGSSTSHQSQAVANHIMKVA